MPQYKEVKKKYYKKHTDSEKFIDCDVFTWVADDTHHTPTTGS
jgi:hypothetical protein